MNEMLEGVARELGYDPAHPDVDQFGAAAAHAAAIADVLGRQPVPPGMHRPAVLKLGIDPLPPQVVGWVERFAGDLADERLCSPAHVRRGTVSVVYANTPNRRYCGKCSDLRGKEIAAAAVNSGDPFRMDCDFCGVPATIGADLRPVFLAVASILVKAFGCERCLFHSTVPA